MLNLGGDCRIWLYTPACDMRRSFDGLSALVRNELGADPTNGHWYVFVNRRRTLLKVLAFDAGGVLGLGQAPGAGAIRRAGRRWRRGIGVDPHGVAGVVGGYPDEKC